LPDSVVLTEKLTKHYGDIVGIDGLDMEVVRGEVFGFLGPNGAGKTTTMRLLMGLLFPTSGVARVLDLDCWKDSVALKREIGYLPGEPTLYPRLNGEEHIRFVAGFNGGSAEGGMRLASRLELDTNRRARDCSRGMKQKLSLVLALMKSPPLLIMDEPTTALDPLTRRVVYDVLAERQESGATILFSSHNLSEVERICDRVGIIRDGSLVATERIDELGGKKLHNVEVTFSGPPPADFASLPGVSGVKAETGDRLVLSYRGDVNELVRYLGRFEISDLAIAHASLEDVFLEYYGSGDDASEAVGEGEGGEAS
jgi:ABC-2 type transport system ATP-binding protein